VIVIGKNVNAARLIFPFTSAISAWSGREFLSFVRLTYQAMILSFMNSSTIRKSARNGSLKNILIVLLVEKIVREALKTQGLNVPPLNNLLKEIKDVEAVHSLHISIPEKEVMVLFQDKQEKMKSYKVKLDM